MKEGLNSLPLHRDWFIGSTNMSIHFKNSLQVYSNNKLLFDFEKNKDQWQQKIEKKFIDWDYFNRVLETFKDFPINKRYDVAATTDKKSFEIRNGREIYTFYLLGRNFWAVKLPKVNWLIASSAWALLEDFKPELWLSKYNSQLQILTDKNISKHDRLQTLHRIGPTWTSSIKKAYHQILLDQDEDNSVKMSILSHIKQKPTTENLKVLAKALSYTEDLDLKIEITKILRLMNPRGPVLSLDKPEKIDEQIDEWQKWAEKLK